MHQLCYTISKCNYFLSRSSAREIKIVHGMGEYLYCILIHACAFEFNSTALQAMLITSI